MNGFMEKKNSLPKRSAKRVVYNRFYPAGAVKNGAGALIATENKNCDFFGQKLRCGVGASRYKLKNETLNIPMCPTEYGNPKDLFAFEFSYDGGVKDSIGVVMGNNRLFIYDELTGTPSLELVATGIKFQKAIRLFDKVGDEKLLLCYNDKIYRYDPIGTTKTLWLEQAVTDACFFKERLFICNGKAIKYSSPNDYENLTESVDDGGTIKFVSERGDALAFAVVGEKVYAFFEKGVLKLDLNGAGRDFVATAEPYGGGKIVKGSICVCADKVCFLAYDGVYAFDGNKFRRFGGKSAVNINVKTSYCRSAYEFGRYYLTFDDVKGVRRTIYFDLGDEDNCGEVFAMSALVNCNGRTLCIKDGYICCLDEDGLLPINDKYLYKVENADFSVSGEKFLRAIELRGRGSCTVKTKGRNGEKRWTIEINGQEKMLVGLKGEFFTLEIELKKGCVIEELVVELERIGGRK
jgi:hypothetical protein